MRMPCVMRWPGVIPAGRVQDEICATMDLLPTLAAAAGAELPERPIDGYDILPLLRGDPGAASPWDQTGFCYYLMEQLQAVRAGPWKLYLPLKEKYVTIGRKKAPADLELYDVRHDASETKECSAEHPLVVKRLLKMADRARRELGDGNQPGSGQRPAGHVARPEPLVELGN
jgi:arylsulfatase A-like enzyme